MLHTVLALALTVAPPLVTAEGVTLTDQGTKPETFPFLGVQMDVGAPDGIGVSLMASPVRWLRVHAGGLNNGLGSGFRGGVTLIGFPSLAFRPLIGFDGGYTFAASGAWLPDAIPDPRIAKMLTNLNLGFFNLQTGFELGSKHLAVTLRVGVSYISANAAGTEFTTGANTSFSIAGISAKGFVPSARLGFLFFF
ncbi:MAG: hypothetical protein U0228_02055 [Myxococcaceae bacterium]